MPASAKPVVCFATAPHGTRVSKEKARTTAAIPSAPRLLKDSLEENGGKLEYSKKV